MARAGLEGFTIACRIALDCPPPPPPPPPRPQMAGSLLVNVAGHLFFFLAVLSLAKVYERQHSHGDKEKEMMIKMTVFQESCRSRHEPHQDGCAVCPDWHYLPHNFPPTRI